MDENLQDHKRSVLSYLNKSGWGCRVEQSRALSGSEFLSKPLRIEVDVFSLAAEFPELAHVLYHDADGFRDLVHQVLVNAGKLHQAERLWIRPISLLEETHTCKEAVNTFRSHPGASIVVQGVCCAASATVERRYSRTFTCNGCGAEAVVLEGNTPPFCCGPLICKTNEPRAAICKTQLIYLTQCPNIDTTGCRFDIGEPTLAVYLQDDLCGQVHVGDRLYVMGTGRRLAELYNGSSMYGCRGAIQVDALTVQRLPAAGPQSACPSSSRIQQEQHPLEGLKELLGALKCCFDTPCKPLVMLALLLSAATAGVSPVELDTGGWNDEEVESYVQQAVCTSRAQVNVLLLTGGHEPHLQRLLHQAAAGLFQHYVTAGISPKQLMPRIFEKFVEPRLQLQVPLSIGGDVTEANSGVLLLNTSQLSSIMGTKLAACVRAGLVNLSPSMPELSVKLTPALWCLAQHQDLGKSHGKLGAGEPGEASERLACKYGQQFLSLWDIHLECSSGDMEDIDLWAEHVLSTAQGQQLCMQATCAPGAGPSAQRDGIARAQCGALAAVQAHLRTSVSQPHPDMGHDAMALLSAYFALIRVAEESPQASLQVTNSPPNQSQPVRELACTLEGVQAQSILESLARVATACARLCHRSRVLPFPDVTLAVAFMEEQLISRGGSAMYWGKWRRELDRGTELMVCLEGLYHALQDSLSTVILNAAEE